MKRRNFIQLTATTSLMSIVPMDLFALFHSAGMTSCPDSATKKIVLIQLSGANDGLNTIIPLNQYDSYAALRPTIKLNNVGTANGIINLDATLALNDQVGIHPALKGFKDLYDNGFLRIIQGVGYPAQDKSHFKSTDLWLSGGDGTSANNFITSGWIGRFLENYYTNYLTVNYPLGMQLGSSDNSLGFHGESEHDMALNINGQDPTGFYSVINGLGGTPPSILPNSEYGDLIKYITENDKATNSYAQSISTAFTKGKNAVTYPATSFANQLKTVAKFISGGLQTKVYLVKIGGFDTHENQIASITDPHLGIHANVLSQLSEGIKTFITDLNMQNLGEDLLALTFSEFGRKAGENASFGTDHGEIAPLFAFGNAINPGISGTNVNLSEATLANKYQIQTVQHDYRRVFSSIIQDWLGASTPTLNHTFFNWTTNSGYSENKISDLIKPQYQIPPSCYSNSILSVEEYKPILEIRIYPNPASEIITINSQKDNNIISLALFSMDGKWMGSYKNPIPSNQFILNVQNFSSGFYTLKVETEKTNFAKKIIIRR